MAVSFCWRTENWHDSSQLCDHFGEKKRNQKWRLSISACISSVRQQFVPCPWGSVSLISIQADENSSRRWSWICVQCKLNFLYAVYTKSITYSSRFKHSRSCWHSEWRWYLKMPTVTLSVPRDSSTFVQGKKIITMKNSTSVLFSSAYAPCGEGCTAVLGDKKKPIVPSNLS